MKNKELATNFHLHQEKDNTRYEKMKKELSDVKKFKSAFLKACVVIGFLIVVTIGIISPSYDNFARSNTWQNNAGFGWLQTTISIAIFLIGAFLIIFGSYFGKKK